jgi:hypothetical protein
VRQSVKALYAAYRPLQGNGDSGKRTVEVEVEAIKPEDLAPIVRKEGEENSSAFWACSPAGRGNVR